MKKLLLLLLVAASINAMAGRESDGENGHWSEGDTFTKPVVLLGNYEVSLLKLRRRNMDKVYKVCGEDYDLNDLEVIEIFGVRGDTQIADNEEYLIQTEHNVFLGRIKERFFSNDCIEPTRSGYMVADEFWQEMENNAIMVKERIDLLNDSLRHYKKTFIKSLGYSLRNNIDRVRYSIHIAFESIREDLGMYSRFAELDHLFIKNAKLIPEINQILKDIDLSLIDDHKDGFLGRSDSRRASFIGDYYFHQNEIRELRKKLKRYLPGDFNRIEICEQINAIYEAYHHGQKNCDV